MSEEELSRKFSRLMMEGKLNAAIRLLEGSSPTVLPLTDYTMHCPQTKHPTAHVKFDNMLLQGFVNLVDKVIYDDISAELIRKSAVRTRELLGPSGLDADFWRKIIGGSVFGTTTSDDLCHAIALMTRQLCSEELKDPATVSVLISCRLITLDKCRGFPSNWDWGKYCVE